VIVEDVNLITQDGRGRDCQRRRRSIRRFVNRIWRYSVVRVGETKRRRKGRDCNDGGDWFGFLWMELL